MIQRKYELILPQLDWGKRYMVAQDRNTSPDVLAFLANDVEAVVRCHVAWNPNTPYGIWIRRWGRVLP